MRKALGEKENCMYLGILEADCAKQTLKKEVVKDFLRSERKILQNNLRRNLIKGERYTRPFLKCTW